VRRQAAAVLGMTEATGFRLSRWRRLRTVALGGLGVIVGALLLPVSDTFAGALTQAGFESTTAARLVIGLFAVGGAEAAVFVYPIFRGRRNRRESE